MNSINTLLRIYNQLHNIKIVLLLIAVLLIGNMFIEVGTRMFYSDSLRLKLFYLAVLLLVLIATTLLKMLLV